MEKIPAIPLRQQRAAGQQPDDVTCIDAHGVRQRYLSDARLFGWELTPYAIQHRRFQGVETGTQLVFLIRRLLRRPTFAAQRVPPSQIFGLPVLPLFAPRL
jgi:hypothetical protein